MTTVAELVGVLNGQNPDATVATTTVAPLAAPVWDVTCAGTGFSDPVTRDVTCRGTGLIEEIGRASCRERV